MGGGFYVGLVIQLLNPSVTVLGISYAKIKYMNIDNTFKAIKNLLSK